MPTEPTKKDEECTVRPAHSDPPVASDSRRRFTKTGLALSGVLMTLASRSSLACQAVSPSGFCSVNQSLHGNHQESRCRRPYYWSSGCSWPISRDTRFRDIFHQCPTHSPYYKATCNDVVCGKVSYDTSHNQCLGQYLIAGYLNACMGWSEDFFKTSDCVTLGNEWLTSGVYRPNAHATWNTGQIVLYFENTQS